MFCTTFCVVVLFTAQYIRESFSVAELTGSRRLDEDEARKDAPGFIHTVRGNGVF